MAGGLRSLALRAALAASICTALLLAISASPAPAVVVHLRNGHRLSYRPLRGHRLAASTRTTRRVHNLEYHGGPIMPSNNNYAFYWRPAGAPAYPAEYQSGIAR